MRKQVVHVSVHQTSKVIASTYAIIIAIVAFIMAIYTILIERDFVTAIFILILIPLFYWIVFYIGHVIGLFFYNQVAKYLGGIEFDLADAGIKQEVIEEGGSLTHADKIEKL